MDEFIKLLDPGLDYISHEIIGDTIVIRVASNKEEAYNNGLAERRYKHHRIS